MDRFDHNYWIVALNDLIRLLDMLNLKSAQHAFNEQNWNLDNLKKLVMANNGSR